MNHQEHQEHQAVSAAADAIGRAVVDSGIRVHQALGPGLLESAYEQCLAHVLERGGFSVRRQVVVPPTFEGLKIDAGYRLDLLVDEQVIVEVKSVEALSPLHSAQVLTYLKLSDLRLGFLMNFNVTLLKQGLKRLVR